MAISRKQKEELVVQYIDWMNRSQALIFTGYRGLSVKEIDDLRSKAREAGGEFHVIKNTLGKVAFKQADVPLPEEYLEDSTAIAFAFKDPAAMAKAVSDFSRRTEFLKIKGGYLEQILIQTEQITALADLPPIAILRAQLLGTIMAPASKFVRVLSEPARRVSTVLNAYAEKDDVSTAT
jgi:large subunit ribosomal protein L10